MQTNREKITKQLCLEHDLLFLPKTHAESEAIQKKLFAMGYQWINTGAGLYRHDHILSYGLALQNCKIVHPPEKPTSGYLLCSIGQFDKGDAPELTPAEQPSLRDEFNQLAALVKDMAKKVDAMYEQIMPQKLDKSISRKPENRAP